MADGLVAGQSEAAKNVAGRADQSFLNGRLHNVSGEMLQYFECIEAGALFCVRGLLWNKRFAETGFPTIAFLS
jgi:hypothetical protein